MMMEKKIIDEKKNRENPYKKKTERDLKKERKPAARSPQKAQFVFSHTRWKIGLEKQKDSCVYDVLLFRWELFFFVLKLVRIENIFYSPQSGHFDPYYFFDKNIYCAII